MISLTLFPLICHPCGAQESAISANLQILTLCRAFLTAPSKRTRDNENHGGNYEAQHLAQLQPNRMGAVVLCNSHGHPPPLVRSVSLSRIAIPSTPPTSGSRTHSPL